MTWIRWRFSFKLKNRTVFWYRPGERTATVAGIVPPFFTDECLYVLQKFGFGERLVGHAEPASADALAYIAASCQISSDPANRRVAVMRKSRTSFAEFGFLGLPCLLTRRRREPPGRRSQRLAGAVALVGEQRQAAGARAAMPADGATRRRGGFCQSALAPQLVDAAADRLEIVGCARPRHRMTLCPAPGR